MDKKKILIVGNKVRANTTLKELIAKKQMNEKMKEIEDEGIAHLRTIPLRKEKSWPFLSQSDRLRAFECPRCGKFHLTKRVIIDGEI